MTDLAYCLPGVGWACWCIGGWRFKWCRRYLMPLLFGWVASVYGVPTVIILAGVILMGVSLSLGYGEGKSWWWRLFVGFLYGVSSLTISGKLTNVNLILSSCLVTPIKLHYFFLILLACSVMPLWFVGLFYLSRKGKLVWKMVEGLTGAMMGVITAMGLMTP